MKYIVLKRTWQDTPEEAKEAPSPAMYQELPVIFPKDMIHARVAEALVEMLKGEINPEAGDVKIEVIAAGELAYPITEKPRCGGHSETMGLKSRGEEDAELIRFMDYSSGLGRERA
jgi:hypothetical protein